MEVVAAEAQAKPRSYHLWSPLAEYASLVASIVEMPPGSGGWTIAISDFESEGEANSADGRLLARRYPLIHEVVQDMMTLSSPPVALAWLETDKAGLVAVALDDGSLGLVDPLLFTLKRMDAPLFDEKIRLEGRVLALRAQGAVLAALLPSKLVLFTARVGSLANLRSKREYPIADALSCDFNPNNSDQLFVMTKRALLVFHIAKTRFEEVSVWPEPITGGIVAYAEGTSVVLATDIQGKGTARMLNVVDPQISPAWVVDISPLAFIDFCPDLSLAVCTTSEGTIVFIDALSGLRHFNIKSEDGVFVEARWLPFEDNRFSAVQSSFAAHLFELKRTASGLSYRELVHVPKLSSGGGEGDAKAYEPGMMGGVYDTFPYAQPTDLSAVKKVRMSDLLDPETVESAAKEFSRQMSKQSYAIVTLSREHIEIIRRAEEVLAAFYKSDDANKQRIKIEPGRDVGYKFTENVKEFFQMRKTDFAEFPWPQEPEAFARCVDDLWDTLDSLSRVLMRCLARGLEIDPTKFDALLDPVPQPAHTFSHTIMGTYNYFAHDKATETCLVHKDMGVITLIPRANIAGLECLDYNIQKWVKAEDGVSDRNDMVVIGCQTLDKCTGSYYAANVHRVINSISRQSIVYKLRARSDAVLDMKGLQSPVLQRLFRYWPPPIRVDDWILNELHYDDSVNFPGASLQNYKKCILDPSLNTSIVDKFGNPTEKPSEEQSMM